MMSRALERLMVALVVLSAWSPVQVRADVLISELCDPRLDYASDRFIEIYNPGSEAADLTGWRLIAMANGAEVFTWNLAGLIDSHQALVAGDATTVAVFPVAFPEEAWSGATGSWNGKVGDGAKLVDPFGTVIDHVVATGTAFENADYVRKAEIIAPNPVYTPAEWTATPVNLASDASPGFHATSNPAVGPTVAAIRTDPAWPAVGDAVHVLAEVTDTGATVTAVALAWGTAATSLPNSIDMSLVFGDTYQTVTPIPSQAGGTTVYFRVEAANDVAAATTSALQSYALALPAPVHEIQGEAAASPLDGMTVVTRGVVTAVYGSAYVIQAGAGAWNGLWVRSTVLPSVGDSVTVIGRVTESDGPANTGNTMLVEAQLVGSTAGAALPEAVTVSSAEVNSESYEGVLVRVTDALCTDADLGAGEWQVDDGSGASRVGALGYRASATLGSTYEVRGPVAYSSGRFKSEPRDAADVQWRADHTAAVLFRVAALNDTALRATFSEALDPVSAGEPGHYVIPGLAVSGAGPDPAHPDQVMLAVSAMTTGDYTLMVSGVEDLYGNAATGTSALFSYYSHDIPPGYYDGATGLAGEALQAALHDIIKGHTAHSYDYAWTAYTTTDVRPDNGKVWDIYSDIPGGTAPYLYTFGADQGGVGGQEGTGYTREHTWCKSWFGGEVSPMYTDLFTLFPCDTHMNGTRGVYAYGETGAPQWISLNGSRLGPSTVPGYSGTVFEPRDDFKGDLARAYFYFSTRYYSEDAGWPGGPATDGAELKPWALEMYLGWNDADPVSRKEIDRNTAVYAIQGNRNPYVDRPDFVDMVYRPSTAVVLAAEGARLADGAARISWKVGDADDPDLYHVYREEADAGRRKLTAGPMGGRSEYVFLDREAPGERTDYWVEAITRNGGATLYGPIEVEEWVRPGIRALIESVAPNPFASAVTVVYTLPRPERVRLEIFDCAGRRLRVLADELQGEGRRTAEWDGRDKRGAAVGAGVYFVRVQTDERTEARRVVLVRR